LSRSIIFYLEFLLTEFEIYRSASGRKRPSLRGRVGLRPLHPIPPSFSFNFSNTKSVNLVTLIFRRAISWMPTS
jgi:hypothetical protein